MIEMDDELTMKLLEKYSASYREWLLKKGFILGILIGTIIGEIAMLGIVTMCMMG